MTDVRALADKEIDTWLYEHAMGWTALRGKEAILAAGHAPDGDPLRFHYTCIWINSENKRMACEECGTLPALSSDPVASKDLRDAMRAKGWRLAFDDDQHGAGYFARWRKADQHGTAGIQVFAETEERAISSAARLSLSNAV